MSRDARRSCSSSPGRHGEYTPTNASSNVHPASNGLAPKRAGAKAARVTAGAACACVSIEQPDQPGQRDGKHDRPRITCVQPRRNVDPRRSVANTSTSTSGKVGRNHQGRGGEAVCAAIQACGAARGADEVWQTLSIHEGQRSKVKAKVRYGAVRRIRGPRRRRYARPRHASA